VVVESLQIMPPFPTDAQSGEEAVRSPDEVALGDTTHATSAAISASQKASAAPIAALLATHGSAFLSAPFASGPCARRSGRLNVSTS
jgi:hypothetical protein